MEREHAGRTRCWIRIWMRLLFLRGCVPLDKIWWLQKSTTASCSKWNVSFSFSPARVCEVLKDTFSMVFRVPLRKDQGKVCDKSRIISLWISCIFLPLLSQKSISKIIYADSDKILNLWNFSIISYMNIQGFRNINFREVLSHENPNITYWHVTYDFRVQKYSSVNRYLCNFKYESICKCSIFTFLLHINKKVYCLIAILYGSFLKISFDIWIPKIQNP